MVSIVTVDELYTVTHCCTVALSSVLRLNPWITLYFHLEYSKINIRYRLVQRSRLTFSFSPIWKKRTILYIDLILCTYF